MDALEQRRRIAEAGREPIQATFGNPTAPPSGQVRGTSGTTLGSSTQEEEFLRLCRQRNHPARPTPPPESWRAEPGALSPLQPIRSEEQHGDRRPGRHTRVQA